MTIHTAALLLLTSVATPAPDVAAVPRDTVIITYVCGNTFRVTNTYQFDARLTWRVVGTEETGGFEVPEMRPGGKPHDAYLTTVEKGTVELSFSNWVVASAPNRGRSACTIPADTIPLELRWDRSYLPLSPALLFADSADPGKRYYGNYLTVQFDSAVRGADLNRLLRQYGMTPLSTWIISTGWPNVVTVRIASRRNWGEFSDFVTRLRSDSRIGNVAILQFDPAPPMPGQWTRLPGLPPLDASRRVWPRDGLEYFRTDLEVHFKPGLHEAWRAGWVARYQAVVTAKVTDDHYFIRMPDPGPSPEEYIRAVARMRKDSVVRQLYPIPLGSVRLAPLAGIVLDEGTDRNVRGGEVCLTIPDPGAARCGRVNSGGRFTVMVAPGRAGVLSWSCPIAQSSSPYGSTERQWQQPFTPGNEPDSITLRVPTRSCDASVGTFEPLTRFSGSVTDARTGLPLERTIVCFSWPVRGEACSRPDSLGMFQLDSMPNMVGTLTTRCITDGFMSRQVMQVSLYPDTLAGPVTVAIDTASCDTRPVRRERRTLSGHYSSGFENSSFVPCPSDSWLLPSDTTSRGGPLGARAWVEWDRSSDSTPGRPATWPRAREFPHDVDAFVRWTGTLIGPGGFGHFSGSPFAFHVDSIVEVRAPRKGDCRPAGPSSTRQ